MSKTIKVIDLLNKIANGEEVPEKIKYNGTVYKLNKTIGWYQSIDVTGIVNEWFISKHKLNDIVEIIEEQEEIDIQSIEEIEPAMNGNACVIDNKTWTLNQVIKAVKQLDKKIKEK